MKTLDEIKQEIETVRKDINNHWNKFLEYEHQGISLNARVHYEDYLRLMGFRDALQWVLKDDNKDHLLEKINNMVKDRPYGLKLVMGVVQSYMVDSGELPSPHDILSHILQMENWEFEQYMEMKDCTEVRTTLDYINDRLEQQEKEKQARIAGRKPKEK